MLALKLYQQQTLEILKAYCQQCVELDSPDEAFRHVTQRVFGRRIEPNSIDELSRIPYVCIRIPTGGGKTLVAAHSTGVLAGELLHNDFPLVLWMVPSNTIREQTLKALGDRRHPYRQALDSYFGATTVLDIEQALHVARSTLDTSATIVVATMQAFRVEETEGRKVYEDNGALMSHFDQRSGTVLDGLETFDNGTPKRSLANVLRMNRPIVIVDEAHNARTPLSFATLARFNPAAVVEFTATPARGDNGSNVLYSVSAAELKAEHMIKLPIRLDTHADWKQLLHSAINRRQQLENLAEQERLNGGDYIRPVMLLQADKSYQHRTTLNVDVLEQTLREEFHIPAEQIARATGTERGIEGIDLSARTCPIRFIITVQALREGWDCPFAYVLLSVAEMRSGTAVEQLLGRILRMPYATERTAPALNLAYACSSSNDFTAVASALKDALVENGFERQSVDDFVQKGEVRQGALDSLPLWRSAVDAHSVPVVIVGEEPDFSHLPADLVSQVVYDPVRSELRFLGERMAEDDMYEIQRTFRKPEDCEAVQRLYVSVNQGLDRRTPSQRGERFAVPLLLLRQGSLLEPFEASHLLERMPSSLAGCQPYLEAHEYAPIYRAIQSVEVDISPTGRVVAQSFVGALHRQMQLLDADRLWSEADLVRWLDARLPNRTDLTQVEAQRFLTRLVVNLASERGMQTEALVRDRYQLLNAVIKKLASCRMRQRQHVFEGLLASSSEADGRLVVDAARCHVFNPENYPYNTLYQGITGFQHHYYPRVGEMNGEEIECARWLDQHPSLRWWVRNLERRPESFSLQTHTDRFYPDFVCQLTDGRTLVVEYKSETLWSTDDSREKRIIGDLWESRSHGACRFVMPKGMNLAAIEAKIAS